MAASRPFIPHSSPGAGDWLFRRSEGVLDALAEIGAGGGEVPRLERELHAVEELAIEPQVNPGHLGDLVVGPPGGQDLLDDAEEVALEVLGERGDGQARDHGIDQVDPAPAEDLGQVADVPLDHVEVGEALISFAEDPGEVGVALQDDDPAVGRRLLGQDLGDRAGARAQLDQHLDAVPGDVADGRPREPGTARSQAGDRRPVLEELAEEEQEIVHRCSSRVSRRVGSDAGFEMPDSRCRIRDAGFEMPDSRCRIRDAGFEIRSGFEMPDSRCRIRDAGFEISNGVTQLTHWAI